MIQLQVGRELFRFTSKADWVSKAQARYVVCGHSSVTSIAVDAKGRQCVVGSDFDRAEQDGAYPVVVYVNSSELARKHEARMSAGARP